MPTSGTVTVTIPDGPNAGLRLHVDQSMPLYYWLKESHDQDLVRELQSRIAPGMVVMDVGANIGYNTMMFARWVGAAGRVLSFEPDPMNMQRLRRHCEINELKGVELLPLALSDQEGQLRFAAIGQGQSRVLTNDTADNDETVMVEAVRMDDVAVSLGLERLDAIKIDVEDHEVAVLRGCEETLGRFKPFVLIEVHSVESLIGCSAVLRKLGYTVEPIDSPELYGRLLASNPESVDEQDRAAFDRGQIMATPPRAEDRSIA
jgi:FkbM family methyltransferase